MTTQREPQIGDKIKLTGSDWNSYVPDLQGQVVTIASIEQLDEYEAREALFDYTNRFGGTSQTFPLMDQHRREDPLDGESWHFADEPRVGDLVKLTGTLWTDAAKEEGPYRVHEHQGGLCVSPEDQEHYRLNVPSWKGLWDVEVLSENPAEAYDEDGHIAIGDWVVMTNKAYGARHPGVYKVVDRTEFGVGGVEITIQRDVDRKFRAGVNDFRKALKAEAYPQILNESIDAEVAAEQAYDMVDPLHYKGFSNGAEPIDILEHLTPNCAAAGKYIIRVGHKPGNDAVQELEKAIRYLRREINLIEGNPSW